MRIVTLLLLLPLMGCSSTGYDVTCTISFPTISCGSSSATQDPPASSGAKDEKPERPPV